MIFFLFRASQLLFTTIHNFTVSYDLCSTYEQKLSESRVKKIDCDFKELTMNLEELQSNPRTSMVGENQLSKVVV